LGKCTAALQPTWRKNGTPLFQPCSHPACKFKHLGPSGTFDVNCATLQGSKAPALLFSNPSLCITDSPAQAALRKACAANRASSELCVSQ
jgi:hypothetical protein